MSNLNCFFNFKSSFLNASNIKTIRVELNTVSKDKDTGWTDLSPYVGCRFNGIVIVKSVHNDYGSGVFGVAENSAWDPGHVFTNNIVHENAKFISFYFLFVIIC